MKKSPLPLNNILAIAAQDKARIEGLIAGLLDNLREQQRCGIDTVSATLEIGALEEVEARVRELGE